jgi:hypothetical protein
LILAALGHEKPEGRASNYGNKKVSKLKIQVMERVAYSSSLASANLIRQTGDEARVAHENSCLDLRDSG